jgi:hypothetical protein
MLQSANKISKETQDKLNELVKDPEFVKFAAFQFRPKTEGEKNLVGYVIHRHFQLQNN